MRLSVQPLTFLFAFLHSVPAPGNSPRHSLPPSPPMSYEQDITELRATNTRLQEQIDNLKVRNCPPTPPLSQRFALSEK